MPELNEGEIRRRLAILARIQPSPEHTKRAIERVRSALTEGRQAPQTQKLPIWRIIMRSNTTKIAAAAVIIVGAVIAGFYFFFGQGSSVAWAELVEHVDAIKTVVYRMKVTMKGLPGMPEDQSLTSEMQARLHYDHGFRIDSRAQAENKTIVTNTYIMFREGAIVSVNPGEKKYIRLKLTDELLSQMEKNNGDPKTVLREMMKFPYTKLGRDTINGIVVEGIEVTDPAIGGGMFDQVTSQLWVDVRTQLPVLITTKASANGGKAVTDMVIDDFQWAVPLDSAELEPNIPADYELLAQGQIGAGKDGKDIVESLRFFAEIADGRYPSSLMGMTIISELREAVVAKYGGEESPIKKDLAKVVKLQTIGSAYAMMTRDGNEPAYYGDRVTAEFPHVVLMRWKIGTDTYRIILGDLGTRDVSAKQLVDLEAQPLNPNPYPVKSNPADDTVGTSLDGVKLSWLAGAHATEHKVYFGTLPNALSLLLTTQGSDCNQVPSLKRDTTYYWRVDAVKADGTVTTGKVWSFNPGYLVAHWKFDDGAGDVAADAGRFGIKGTLVGDPAWVKGIIGGALEFDGDGDYVDLGNDPHLEIANQITVAAWIKVNAFNKEWQTIAAKGDSSWRLQRNWGQNTLEFGCSGLITPGSDWGGIYGKTDVNDGRWHHVAGTYDGKQSCLYIDGRLDASASTKGKIKINDQSVFIGANADKPNRNWNGLIDDVRIYNYALSAEQIAEIAAAAK